MRVAIPEWNGRVSPVFDSARQLLVIDTCDGAEISRAWTPLVQYHINQRAQLLAQLRVETLICCAISIAMRSAIRAQGVKVIPHVRGDIQEVLRAYLEKGCFPANLIMPGSHPADQVARLGSEKDPNGQRRSGTREISSAIVADAVKTSPPRTSPLSESTALERPGSK